MSSGQENYSDSYFDIDDILTTQEKLPCKVELPIYRLGYLDPSCESDDLLPGTKLDLPYWMARGLCSRKRHIVSVDSPKQYRTAYREILTADANVVDLHKLGPYFYRFGSCLLNFEYADATDIAKCLLKTFQARFRRIMDCSQNVLNEDTSVVTSKLDEMERSLFSDGQKGLNDFNRWEKRETEKLSTSHMVRNHRKRKRAAVDT
ncbi:DNA replication complex GINS protein PSF3-like [Gigantopelta aegis]|uniref:DNA replication complex GINS protein PSF3-like n=1 Tax=Gigantopelta aegis TaxID=1735272 RepID=UPI001B88B6E9|nr:DNA replication complex GINS protein PSF3-like [Gigantopelta aegis]